MASEPYRGKEGISAKILAHSVTSWGKEIVTFELEYPRFIHPEFMTHRLFSRNCASSRAIPEKKMHSLIEKRPAVPVSWGKNQAGMQAYEECTTLVKWNGMELSGRDAWLKARDGALQASDALAEAGYHKQIVNRITEPFQMIKTVLTATELANFFYLRDHHMAQPEIRELAKCMLEVLRVSKPILRSREGNASAKDWYHLPYLSDQEREQHSLDDIVKISVARCAAVSFRNEDYPVEKCREVYDRLVGGNPKHSSALEHAALVMERRACIISGQTLIFENGVSHVGKDGEQWSGNFRGWIQQRKLLPGESVW